MFTGALIQIQRTEGSLVLLALSQVMLCDSILFWYFFLLLSYCIILQWRYNKS